jgi:hypothetical protein
VFQGHEKDIDQVLVKGDLGKDNFFTRVFERQEGLSGSNMDDKTHHGNKGTNMGNLESEEMRTHIVDQNKKMAQHYHEANVKLSDFKPTQNVEIGKENKIDKVLVSGNLGDDKFFSRAFENQAKIDEQHLASVGMGNKGHNVGNLSSYDFTNEIANNLDKISRNVNNSHIVGDDFKPNHDVFVGHDMRKEPTQQEAFKGQSLEQTLEDKGKHYPQA